MQIELTSDQQAFAQRAVEAGRLDSEAAAVQEALALWEERERKRAEFIATLNDAHNAISRGEGREITPESMRLLSSQVAERRIRQLDATHPQA